MPILLCSLCSSAFPARGTRPVVGCRPGRDARHSPVSVPDRWNSSRPTPIRTCATPSIWKRSLGSTSRSPKPSRGRGPAASREECHGQPAVLSISSSRRRLLVSERRRRTAASKQRPILPLAAVRTQVTSWWIGFGHVPAGARGKAHVRALRDHGEEERGSGSTHGLMSAVAVPVCPSIACGAVEC